MLKNISNNNNSIFIPLLSILPFFIQTTFIFTDTYYIDNFSLIFIMQLFCIAFEFKNFFDNKIIMYISFFITGIATGIKISNILLIFPLYIYIFIKNICDIKKIKIKNIIICFLLFLLPFIIYMIDNIVQTGNPIFPYYNNIFNSKYFDNISWSDENFGIKKIWQAFIWPFMAIYSPLKVSDINMVDYIWGLGYLVLLFFLTFVIFKRKKINNKKLIELSILTFLLSIIWAIFMMGYTRYASIIPSLYLIIFSSIFLNLKNIKKIYLKIPLYILSFIIIFFFVFSKYNIFLTYKNFIVLSIKTHKTDFIINDRCTKKIHIDGAWLVLSDDSQIATLVREKNTPIYNLETRFLFGNITQNMQKKLSETDLYILIDSHSEEKKLNALKQHNFEIVEIIDENIELDFLPKSNLVNIYKVKYVK